MRSSYPQISLITTNLPRKVPNNPRKPHQNREQQGRGGPQTGTVCVRVSGAQCSPFSERLCAIAWAHEKQSETAAPCAKTRRKGGEKDIPF